MGRATGPVTFDVLVIGAGIAGCEAALAAAGAGARVGLASAGATFSGSSFFPGTWGLGLVGPSRDGEKDVEDLVVAICEVGRGMALPGLARVLARGVDGAVGRLEARGVELRRAERADERDYIPCFDRAHRSWRGIVRASYASATERALAAAGVARLERCELLDLLEGGEGVCGAVLADAGRGAVREVRARSVVLATGGFGGLFSRTLTTPDVTGTAAAVALLHGAKLLNAEFLQIMPGLVDPVTNVVFNERTFRYAQVEGLEGAHAAALLDERGGHGPFTASLPDREVDLAVARCGERGARVSFDLPEVLPEFMETYFSWFEGRFGLPAAGGVRIAPYAHAANGGVLVDGRGQTGVPGLYACGEATGGMHGADRIGGLSSANALVFGEIAGREAALRAAGREAMGTRAHAPECEPRALVPDERSRAVLGELRHAMSNHALVVRTEEGLRALLGTIDELGERLGSGRVTPAQRRAELSLLSARALVTAMLARRESRGGHFRADFPEEDPAQERPLVVELVDGDLVAKPIDPAGTALG